MKNLSVDRLQHIDKLLTDALGKPAYSRLGVWIYQMDCIDGMRRLPAGVIDLTVTSPPYNIGKEYEQIAHVPDYVAWCEQWLSEVARLCADTGAFWLNAGYLSLPDRAKALPIPYLIWDKVPLFLIQEVVWHYGAGVAARRSFSPRNEKFLWFVKHEQQYTFNLDAVRDPNVKYPNQKKNGKLKCNPLGKNPSDVWDFPKVTSGTNRSSVERTPHPAQFPLAVIDRIVKATSNANDLVLDPFMGSGTTAEVALANGRLVLGFEIEKAYIGIAAERLEAFENQRRANQAQASLPLFEQKL